MNILLFGAPGTGKGTQSAKLVADKSFFQISTGDLLRAAIKNATQLGKMAQVYTSKGELVPDELVISIVKETILANKGRSFIFDGFPRNVPQAEALERMLSELGLKLNAAVFLEVPGSVLQNRLVGRRACKSCNSTYHIELKRPKVEGVCDVCGESLYQRDDDKEDVILNRLNIYEKNTLPLKEYYKGKGILKVVDGKLNEDEVYSLIVNQLV